MSKNSRNQIIDGWRGLSVLLVILGHAFSYRFGVNIAPIRNVLHNPAELAANLLLRVVSSGGGLGVDFFFVISGYLITSLLIDEENKNGKISIRAFFVRRIFRIMPAFYLYFLTIFCLATWGPIVASPSAFMRSGLYVCNFSGFACSWWLAHTWSLSVEEQFYVCWPLLFFMLGSNRKTGIAGITAALVIGSWWYDFLAPFAHIAIGALAAVSLEARNCIVRIGKTPVLVGAALLLLMQPLAFPIPTVAWGLYWLKPMLIAILFFGTLSNPKGAKLFGNRYLASVGLVSYSLYLWQQFSLAPSVWGSGFTGATGLYADFPELMSVLFVPIALGSYQFVERPLIRVGHRISGRIVEEASHSVLTPV